MEIIDGKAHAEIVLQKITQEVEALFQKQNAQPTLAVVLVGEDPASKVYVANKQKKAKQCGMNSLEFLFAANATEEELLAKVEALNQDPKVNGILVQLPLPSHINESRVLRAIDPMKDVDGFHPINVGKLSVGDETAMTPCTPLGCSILLKSHLPSLTGLHAVIVGRSNIVGKPLAQLLLQENMTVTMLHSKSNNIEALCAQADVLIAAVGRAEMVKKEWLKKGATVIDVGINRITVEGKTKLVGDVDFDDVKSVVAGITPVPGGVGPMTIACLLQNTLRAYRLQHKGL